MKQEPVLKVENLRTLFKTSQRGKFVHAVDDVSINLFPGEIVGLVGESGCGKSTLGRTIVGLETATSGKIFLDGTDLNSLGGSTLRNTRRAIQYIFQDPYSSLNERQTIGEAITEALSIAGTKSRPEQARRVKELLDQVGLAETIKDRHTRELSGGQRQRVAIARSLAVNPRVLICDEPVSALDLSIRAQVMNLFLRLQKELNVACLFIAHDLALVRQAASRVYVMYLGKIVEQGPSQELFDNPSHPYSQMLLASVPEVDPLIEREREAPSIMGELPSPIDPPSGCRFRTRCPLVVDECALRAPPSIALSASHEAKCLYAVNLHSREQTALLTPQIAASRVGELHAS